MRAPDLKTDPRRLAREKRDAIQAAFDLLGHGQGRRQAFGEKTAAWRGDGLVDGRQQGPLPRTHQGFVKFEIGPRRGIDVHPRPG